MRRTFSNPLRALALKRMPWLPAASEREGHFCRLYAIWAGWIRQMRARGPCSEDDDSMWACITRVRDPATGAVTGISVGRSLTCMRCRDLIQ